MLLLNAQQKQFGSSNIDFNALDNEKFERTFLLFSYRLYSYIIYVTLTIEYGADRTIIMHVYENLVLHWVDLLYMLTVMHSILYASESSSH